jgi:hypothetical protein
MAQSLAVFNSSADSDLTWPQFVALLPAITCSFCCTSPVEAAAIFGAAGGAEAALDGAGEEADGAGDGVLLHAARKTTTGIRRTLALCMGDIVIEDRRGGRHALP